jgi:hypothetical protein
VRTTEARVGDRKRGGREQQHGCSCLDPAYELLRDQRDRDEGGEHEHDRRDAQAGKAAGPAHRQVLEPEVEGAAAAMTDDVEDRAERVTRDPQRQLLVDVERRAQHCPQCEREHDRPCDRRRGGDGFLRDF